MGKKQSKQRNFSEDTVNQDMASTSIINRASISCCAVIGQHLLCGNQKGVVSSFNTDTRQQRGIWQIHEKEITKIDVCYSTDTYYTVSRDKNVCITTVNSNASKKLSGHTLAIMGVASNSDGTQIVTGGRDCTVALWDTNSGVRIKSNMITRNLVTDLKWMKDENIIVQCSEDKILKLWDSRSMKNTSSFPMKQYFQACCDVDKNQMQAVTGSVGGNGSGCEVIVWDIRQMNQVRTMKGHSRNITSCRYLKTGSQYRILSTSADSSVKVWDPLSSVCLCTYFINGGQALTSCDITDDGNIFVTTLQGAIHQLYYDVAKEQLNQKFVF